MNRWLKPASLMLLLGTAACGAAQAQFTLPPSPHPIDSMPAARHAASRSAPAVPNADACHMIINDFYFGTYTAGQSAVLLGTLGITIHCDTPMVVQLSVSPSANMPDFVSRAMKKVGGDDLLHYQLFTDWTRTRIWGDGSGQTSLLVLDTSDSDTANAFGSVGALQNVSAGDYVDDVTVTLEF
ncbi:Csu type fimbrial protein [Dyella subtropica]|uniref:Csu type fimbrial protein n=1 Tax=Dyella subtropica TaxID=2992127 RepID=UPI0022564CDC|nr:spore coat U domain-containing protein [Dyella subtropica]